MAEDMEWLSDYVLTFLKCAPFCLRSLICGLVGRFEWLKMVFQDRNSLYISDVRSSNLLGQLFLLHGT